MASKNGSGIQKSTNICKEHHKVGEQLTGTLACDTTAAHQHQIVDGGRATKVGGWSGAGRGIVSSSAVLPEPSMNR